MSRKSKLPLIVGHIAPLEPERDAGVKRRDNLINLLNKLREAGAFYDDAGYCNYCAEKAANPKVLHKPECLVMWFEEKE